MQVKHNKRSSHFKRHLFGNTLYGKNIYVIL